MDRLLIKQPLPLQNAESPQLRERSRVYEAAGQAFEAAYFVKGAAAKFLNGDIAYAMSIALLSRAMIFLLSQMFNGAFGVNKSPLESLCSWDCGWYMSIIERGYDLQPHGHAAGDAANWAFFPLFPMAARFFSTLFQIGGILSATIFSNACFVLALCILFKYAKKFLDIDSARFVILALAFSPYSIYFSVPYTESLYLLLMLGALYFARSDKWILAALFAAMLSATRNLGVFIVFPMLVICLRQYEWKDLIRLKGNAAYASLALFIAPLGLFLYMFFLHHQAGDALAFKNVQVAWDRIPDNPLKEIFGSLRKGNWYEKYCSLVACASLLASAYLFVKRFRAEALVLFIGIMIPASAGIVSMPRYALTLFPIFLALGLFTKRYARSRAAILCCNASLLGFVVMSWITAKDYMP
jgi:hypothetical protein